eukprot:2802300-Lingulodinium_polyedra.AAC.1
MAPRPGKRRRAATQPTLRANRIKQQYCTEHIHGRAQTKKRLGRQTQSQSLNWDGLADSTGS